MELIEEASRSARKRRGRDAAAQTPEGKEVMESRACCAYNQTRECFLGLEVRAADLPYAGIGKLMSSRPLKSGEGLWLTPFRGLPAAAIPAPLDLIYLDDARRVIETVESFPTFQASATGPRPDSVLALPAHSIYSSQTQAGDQLVLCVAEEMEQQLERLSNGRGELEAVVRGEQEAIETAIAGAVLLREKPLWSGGPGVLELENRTAAGNHGDQETHQMDLAPPAMRSGKQLKNWFERWWSPDPRKAPRIPGTGVAAYYWNGSVPAPHGVRDISSSGLYVVTEERWYPGTLVLMTLQRTDCGEEVAERSVSVHSRAVRWGPDGVGLQFVLSDGKEVREGKMPMLDAAGKNEVHRFLELLKKNAKKGK
jgi:uncharacterized protein